MKLTVSRDRSANNCTLGELLINGDHFCWTLEDAVREIPGQQVATWKIRDGTAIPAGRYRVIIDFSPHFGKPMPHILNVPGFLGVRIHPGNTIADTEGCLLLGMSKTLTGVTGSRAAFNAFMPRLQAALQDAGEVWIEYFNSPSDPVLMET